jgi:hypothetical protein
MPQDIPPGPLGPARDVRGYADKPLSALTRKRFACPQDPKLYPTHPSMSAKEYHVFRQATYDRNQLDGRDDACMLSQVKDERKGMRNNLSAAARDRIIAQADAAGRKIFCQLGHDVHQVALSDTYIDACGNYYRGVKSFAYKVVDDNMGTLFSPGRTNYNRGATMGEGQYDGDTYAVPHTEFAFLAELLPGDMGKIEQGRAAARSTHTLDAAGRIFRSRRS